MKLFIIIFYLLSIVYISFADIGNKQPENQVKITIFNPFFISIVVEAKCDYDRKYKNNYKFYEIITIPKRKNVILNVPNYMKLCEVWPLELKW